MKKGIPMSIKKPFFKTKAGEALGNALLIAPALAVLILSSLYCFGREASGGTLGDGFSLVLAFLTAAAVLASVLLGVIWDRPVIPLLFAVLFWLCFVSRLIFLTAGTTDPVEDAFFQMVLIVLSFPAFSFQPLSELFADPSAASLVTSGVLAVLCTAAYAIPAVTARKKGRI